MAPAAKKGNAKRTRHLSLDHSDSVRRPTKQEARQGSWAHHKASDATENVQIIRPLEGENCLGGSNDADPIVDVYFAPGIDPALYRPGNVLQAPTFGDGWQGVRWSDVNRLIEDLILVRETAIESGMLPHPETYRNR